MKTNELQVQDERPAQTEEPLFVPQPSDLLAELPAERRLFDPTRTNYHE